MVRMEQTLLSLIHVHLPHAPSRHLTPYDFVSRAFAISSADASCRCLLQIPTMTTSNQRILLLLKNGAAGLLRTVDAERLQVGF